MDHGAILGLAALLALVAAAWIYRKRFPLAAFGVFMFLLLLAPTSSFIPIRDVQAEHRLYLPFLGLVLVCLEVLRRLRFQQAAGIGRGGTGGVLRPDLSAQRGVGDAARVVEG